MEKNKGVQNEENDSLKKSNTIKKFMRHYLDLFPLAEPKLTQLEMKKALSVLKGKDLSFNNFQGKVLTLVSKSSSVKSFFVYLLMNLPFLSEARFLSLSEILEMQFSIEADKKTIRDIYAPFILIYIDSVTNKLKDEYLLKAVEYWCRKGGCVWIYFKGLSTEWVAGFPRTVEFAKTHRFSSLDLNNPKAYKQQSEKSAKDEKQENDNQTQSKD